MRSSILITSACAAFAALTSLVACSASSVPNDGLATGDQNAKDGTKKDGGASTSNSSGGMTANPSNPTSGDASAPGAIMGTGQCASAGNQDTCFSCCDKAFPKATDFLDKQFGDCACTTPGTCKTQCAASFCAATYVDPKMGDACDTCLTGAAMACDVQSGKACDANADCAPLFKCYDDAKCETRAK